MKLFPLGDIITQLKSTNLVLVNDRQLTLLQFEDLNGENNHVFLKLSVKDNNEDTVFYQFTEGMNGEVFVYRNNTICLVNSNGYDVDIQLLKVIDID